MRIAITAQAPAWDAAVDPRFGRARCFVVVDTEKEGLASADNSTNLNAAQGAGIQAGKNVVDLGVEAVITGHIGPKAFATLRAGGVKVYTGASGTVAEALAQFKSGKLQCTETPDVEGHWA